MARAGWLTGAMTRGRLIVGTGGIAVILAALVAGAGFGAADVTAPAALSKGVAAKPAPAKAAKAKPKSEKERERQGKGEDLDQKFIPPEHFAGDSESGVIRGHSAWRWHILSYPKTTIPPQAFSRAARWVEEKVPVAERWPARQETARATGITIRSDEWTPIGPTPIDMETQSDGYKFGRVTGRFNAVALDPRTLGTPGAVTAFAGAASGGLWKSENCCTAATTWVPLWDEELLATQAVGAIEFDPNDPDTLYAGTGDFDAADQFGEGFMKSTDGGQTWTQYATDIFSPFAAGSPRFQNQNIGVIRVDPNNSNTVLVGTRFDLFISHDAGHTFTRCVFGANPFDPLSTGAFNALHRISGILLDPTTNPTTVYVAVGYTSSYYNGDNGVYKGTVPSTGTPALTLMANGWPAGTGSGTNGATAVGRIRLAASRGNTQGNLVLYAQVQDASQVNALGTWVTTDGANTWKLLAGSTDPNYKDCARAATQEGQDWYNLFILADPGDDKTLYIGRVDLYKATVDPTYSSMAITDLSEVYSQACDGYGSLHPDQHGGAWLGGTGATGRFVFGGDGGLYVADGTVGGFTALNDTVGTIQWYAGQTGADLAGGPVQYFFAGSQDNGTASWDSSNTDLEWQARGNGGDGFFSAFDPIAGSLTTGNWLYEYVYGRMYRSTMGADSGFSPVSVRWGNDRTAWSAPFRMDVFHGTDKVTNNVIFGSNFLYASVDGGGTWKKVAKKDLTKKIGSVVSLDFAMSTPTSVVIGTDDGNVQWSNKVFKGAKCTQANANTANLKCNANALAKWTDLTQSNAVLPNRAVMGVTFDPTTDQMVYAAVAGFNANTSATPGHVFQCTNSGGAWIWKDKTGNLPDIPAESIVINPNNSAQAFVGTDMGFYFTNDITAASPVWERFQNGLPNTLIQYLTVDRGPVGHPYASTTLTAFTYGRGTFAIRLPGPTGFPVTP